MATSPAASNSSRITVSWKQLTFFVVYAVALSIGGMYLAARTHYQPLGALMVVCGIAVLISKVMRGAGKASCPSCGHALDDLLRSGRNPSVLCEACGQFQEGEGGVLRTVPLDRVAATPLFPARMPATLVWPAGCPVCAAPTVRVVEAKVMQVNAAGSLAASAANPIANVIAGSTTHIAVPHCAAHDDGVKLQGAISGGAVDVVFRSYPYQRAFCAANQVRPAPLILASRSSGPLAQLVPRG